MIRLSRETRFGLVAANCLDDGTSKNSWAGWPAADLVVPQLRLQLVISGKPDEKTGYLCNIKLIDQMFRKIIVDDLIPRFNANANETGNAFLDLIWERVQENWPKYCTEPTPTIEHLALHLSPYLALAATPNHVAKSMSSTMSDEQFAKVTSVTQQFEFSAAHRLHCDELSAERNVELFGKCNNPNGHGHNYVVEVTVSQPSSGDPTNLRHMESIVKRMVVDPLDHKHLNEDVPQFAELNPTVENIASVIFDWLDGQFGESKLTSVKVFETPKTWAERRAV